jgi:hypothetical protein
MAVALWAAGLAAAPAAGQEPPNLAVAAPPAALVSVERAVEDAVRFLIANQNADGSFGRATSGRTWEVMADVPGSHDAFKAATTALCWMGLRDAPFQSPESDAAARRALAWLAGNARVKRPNGVEMYNVWAFAYGLRALSQALRTGAPGAEPAAMRATATALVEALAIYQVPDGGWGYYDFEAQTYRPSWTSMSFTTATVLVGLHEARLAGIDVKQDMLDRAITSLRRCRKEDGSYLYGPYLKYAPNMGVNQPKGSAMRTPACNLVLWLYDAGATEADLSRGLELTQEHHRFAVAGLRRPIPHESWYQVSGYFYLYGYHYAALCLEKLPPETRRRFRPHLIEAILKARQPDGSFWDYPLYGYHKFYGTGYALIALARCGPEPAEGE